MRIKVIRPASKQNTALDFQEHSVRVLQSFASPGTQIDVVFPEEGPHAGPMVGHISEARIASAAPFLVYEAVKAEQEGYDAVYFTGEYDVGAEIARHLVKIPVVDTGPVALHTAALLGDRISILVVEDSLKSFTRKLLRRWGMSDFVVSLRPWNIPVSEVWERRSEVRETTLRICRQAVEEDDANVIVPFCAVFTPHIITTEEIEAEVGVPVLNTMAVGIRVTEMFVNLKVHRSQKVYPYTEGGLDLFSYARHYAVAGSR
ncbi:MAG: hypothetical protein HY670_03665 [Chloroflexi bacterium]|nr:hypothetical protein [Chloroflexota bacterium]